MGYLNDEYCVQGNDIQEFEECLNDMDENTDVKEVKLPNLQMLSYQDFGNTRVLVELKPKNTFKKNKKSITLKTVPYDPEMLTNAGYDEALVEEAENTGLFFGSLKDPSKVVPISSYAILSMSQRAALGGPSAIKKSLSRDIAFCENFNKSSTAKMIIRNEDSLKKVFAVMSNDYQRIPQKTILTLLDAIRTEFSEFGSMECEKWSISHSITYIYVRFPEMEKEYEDTYGISGAIPGLFIETSDIGMCAFRLKGFIEMNKIAVFTRDEYSRIHTGSIDIESVIDTAKKKILPEMKYFPERLADLMNIDITDDSMTYDEKAAALRYACEQLIKETGIKKIIGKKRAKLLSEYLTDSYYPNTLSKTKSSVNITAYDVADMFLSLPDRLENVPDSVRNNISEVLWKVFEYDYAPEPSLCVA